MTYKSNLGAGQEKFANSNTLEADQQDSRKHWFYWLRNLIQCVLNYIPEPIKHTNVLRCPVEFCLEIRLGSASVC